MNIKQKINTLLFGLLAVFSMATIPLSTYAVSKSCGVETSIITCKDDDGKSTVNNESGKIEENGVWALLVLVLNILTAGIGVVAVGGIVYGSILYASAGDKTEQVKKGISVITNVVVGLIMYVAMYAILQFIIPGGIFS